MCRSCADSPTGQPIRCNRADGFTQEEGTARTRTRALNSMVDQLDGDDPAAAARAAARAMDAQERLDLMADPDSAPSRPIFANPRSVPELERILGEYQLQHPEDPIHFTIDNYVMVSEEDQAVGSQWVRFTVHSKDIETLPDRVTIPADFDTSGTPVISTYYGLASARAHMNANGGFVKKGEENSTADALVSKFRLPKDARQQYLPDTKEAFVTAFEAREYLQSMKPTTDFERRVQAVASKEFVEEKDLPLLAAGANLYEQEQQRTARETQAAEKARAAAARQPRPRREGEWLGVPGYELNATGRVLIARRAYVGDSAQSRYMYVVATASGDRVRMFSDKWDIREGDYVTFEGEVSDHDAYDGMRQTNIDDAYIHRVNPETGRFA